MNQQYEQQHRVSLKQRTTEDRLDKGLHTQTFPLSLLWWWIFQPVYRNETIFGLQIKFEFRDTVKSQVEDKKQLEYRR